MITKGECYLIIGYRHCWWQTTKSPTMVNNSDTVQKIVIQIELVGFYAAESYHLVTVATWSLKRQWIKVTSDVIEKEGKIKSHTQHMNTEHTQFIVRPFGNWLNGKAHDTADTVLHARCTNAGCQVIWATEFWMLIPNICGSSVWNLLHITLLVPRILSWLLHLWRICGPLCYTAHLLWNAAMLSNTSKTSEN